jgi:HEAT repeat protein
MTSSSGRQLQQTVVILSFAIQLLLAAGCSGVEDPSVARAKSVYQQIIEQDRQYAAYAASIASANSSPFIEQLLLERAASDHYPTALEAVKALQDDPPAAAAAVMEQVFANKSGALKMQAAIALARFGSEEAMAWLKKQVVEGSAMLSAPVALLLAEKGENEALQQQLEKLMQSESLVGRNEAYAILGALARPWATEMLVRGLDKEHGEDRQTAIAAIGRTGDPEAAKRITRFTGTQGLVFVTLEALGDLGNPDSIPVLEGMLEHEQDLVRVYAGIGLWKLGRDEPAVAALEPLLEAEDPVVRRSLAEQLGTLGGEKAVEWLRLLAADEDREVRLHAMRSLAYVATPADEQILIEAAADKDYEVAAAAMNGLAKAGGAEAIDKLAPLLESNNPYLALSAANAILAIGARAESEVE